MKLIHSIAFVFLYLWEVILSTVNLVILVVRPQLRLKPCFVDVPLDLKGEFSRFLFACLVSMTPGTLSVSLDGERGTLLVHLLDSSDPEASIRELKTRIEMPLLRIFGPLNPRA
jgi:multicomponent K+:H+ antiporter subunit E